MQTGMQEQVQTELQEEARTEMEAEAHVELLQEPQVKAHVGLLEESLAEAQAELAEGFGQNSEPTVQAAQKGCFYKRFVKRPLDFILALMALIILSPFMLIIALLVRIKLGSPVIFKQQRPGLDEKIFTMYKFRTMTNECNENGELLPDSVRLTKFGSFLRSTSLDELPELWNILKGDMSIVGPRPQLVRDMVFMTEEQRRRHSVMPGLTGWAQVNGRNAVTWEEKLALDLDYVDDITFLKDVKIIFMTVAKVFKREGISAENCDTAEDLGDYLLRTGKISEETYIERIEKSKMLINSL
jgi:undecaprenyl phosphate N,N'-diacetylbacillosamine 1-phosphate transferase